MRKFAFLLALIAVFAMSAAAFAANESTAFDKVERGKADANNGAVVTDSEGNISTTIYYFGKPEKYGLTLSADANDTSAPATDTLKANAGTVTGSIGAKGTTTVITITDIPFGSNDIEVGNGNPDASAFASADITVVPQAVAFALSEGDLVITKGKGLDDTTISLVSEDIAAAYKFVLSGDTPEDIDGTVVQSADKKINFVAKDGALIVSADKTISADLKFVIEVWAASDATISVDNIAEAEQPKVLGIENDTVLATLTITTEADPNAAVNEAVIAAAAEDKITLPAATLYTPVGSDADVIDSITKAELEAIISDDVDPTARIIGSTTVVTEVPDGGYTVIPSNDVAELATGALIQPGDTLTYVKAFIGKKMSTICEDIDEAFDFPYNLVIIDDAAPADYKFSATDSFGCFVSDATGTMYVWDGDKDGYAIDPIIAVKTTRPESGGSSSGACSMGFGLAAIAGLAALVLKKRG